MVLLGTCASALTQFGVATIRSKIKRAILRATVFYHSYHSNINEWATNLTSTNGLQLDDENARPIEHFRLLEPSRHSNAKNIQPNVIISSSTSVNLLSCRLGAQDNVCASYFNSFNIRLHVSYISPHEHLWFYFFCIQLQLTQRPAHVHVHILRNHYSRSGRNRNVTLICSFKKFLLKCHPQTSLILIKLKFFVIFCFFSGMALGSLFQVLASCSSAVLPSFFYMSFRAVLCYCAWLSYRNICTLFHQFERFEE